MRWKHAQELLAMGLKVRRDVWESSLIMNRRGEIYWDLRSELLEQCNSDGSDNPSYDLSPHDLKSDDWKLA